MKGVTFSSSSPLLSFLSSRPTWLSSYVDSGRTKSGLFVSQSEPSEGNGAPQSMRFLSLTANLTCPWIRARRHMLRAPQHLLPIFDPAGLRITGPELRQQQLRAELRRFRRPLLDSKPEPSGWDRHKAGCQTSAAAPEQQHNPHFHPAPRWTLIRTGSLFEVQLSRLFCGGASQWAEPV